MCRAKYLNEKGHEKECFAVEPLVQLLSAEWLTYDEDWAFTHDL